MSHHVASHCLCAFHSRRRHVATAAACETGGAEEGCGGCVRILEGLEVCEVLGGRDDRGAACETRREGGCGRSCPD